MKNNKYFSVFKHQIPNAKFEVQIDKFQKENTIMIYLPPSNTHTKHLGKTKLTHRYPRRLESTIQTRRKTKT